MTPSAPRNEDFMQALVASHPEIISDQDGALLLIRREQPISDSDDGGSRWSLDHLFVTRTGIPVLVELKRAVDTRLRREVVGQMLDYAANGTAYWQSGRIAESFARSMTELGQDPDAELLKFIGDETRPEEFWDRVDANFSAGRIKMVFVADQIPSELARIVEFLNEQMRADVRAVELTWFESTNGHTALLPRIIGETQRALNEKATRKSQTPIARDEWIQTRLAPFGNDVVEAAQHYIDMIEELGGQANVTSAQGSIMAEFPMSSGLLYPLRLSPERRGLIQFCLTYLKVRPAFAEAQVREQLVEQLSKIVGPLSPNNIEGYPGFDARTLNNDAVKEELQKFLRNLIDSAE